MRRRKKHLPPAPKATPAGMMYAPSGELMKSEDVQAIFKTKMDFYDSLQPDTRKKIREGKFIDLDLHVLNRL